LERIRKNPLTRSYRVDKLTLAALEATLALYRDPTRALREIPVLTQLTHPAFELRNRASAICAAIGSPAVTVLDTEASVGGGAFPTARIPSAGVAIAGNAQALESALRSGTPALIARVADGRVIIDLRAIFPTDDARVVSAVQRVLQ
ncbi:MAG: L-seryl-tRNA(Sec) selenium transferase, partial [Gemmatimonadaceae bacterium]